MSYPDARSGYALVLSPATPANVSSIRFQAYRGNVMHYTRKRENCQEQFAKREGKRRKTFQFSGGTGREIG